MQLIACFQIQLPSLLLPPQQRLKLFQLQPLQLLLPQRLQHQQPRSLQLPHQKRHQRQLHQLQLLKQHLKLVKHNQSKFHSNYDLYRYKSQIQSYFNATVYLLKDPAYSSPYKLMNVPLMVTYLSAQPTWLMGIFVKLMDLCRMEITTMI